MRPELVEARSSTGAVLSLSKGSERKSPELDLDAASTSDDRLMTNQYAISVVGLRKSYASHLVLDGIDMHIATGTVFALLGPYGAGKTTVVNILTTLISADAGEIYVAGHDLAADPQAVRASIGDTANFRPSTAGSPSEKPATHG
jgi:ABC-type bacteriocin/lantibiotic exporter with double-glycine peptidase domain